MNLPPLITIRGFPPSDGRPKTTIACPGGTRLYCLEYTAIIATIARVVETPTVIKNVASSIPPPTA